MMAKYGLGLLEEEPSSAGLVDLSPPPPPHPPDDVHNVSTMVAELPPHLLESMKPPSLREPPDGPLARPLSLPSSAPRPWHGGAELFDLAGRLDADEPQTLQLDTVLLDASSIPDPSMDEAPPQTIELHVIRESNPLAAIESELARLPRPWAIGGALVASVSIAGVIAMLCWTLVQLVF